MNTVLSIATGALMASSLAASAATLVSQYTFGTGFTDNLAGSVASGDGTVSGGSYNFAANEGLEVTLGASLTEYSIVFGMELDATAGYRKLIDVANLVADNGLYNQGGTLRYYSASSNGGSILPSVDSTIALTFDGTNTVGYVDGIEAFSFAATGLGYLTTLSSFIMFEDDTATGQSEASSGSLDFLEVYDGVLTSTELANFTAPLDDPAPVPLPAGGVLLLTGLAGLMAARRKKA